MNSAFDAWRDQILAHERDTSALSGRGHAHGHGHGHAHRAFRRANRPLDPWRADDPVLNGLYAVLGRMLTSSTSVEARAGLRCPWRRGPGT